MSFFGKYRPLVLLAGAILALGGITWAYQQSNVEDPALTTTGDDGVVTEVKMLEVGGLPVT